MCSIEFINNVIFRSICLTRGKLTKNQILSKRSNTHGQRNQAIIYTMQINKKPSKEKVESWSITLLLTSLSLRTSSLIRSKSCQLADWPLHKRLCGRPVTIAAVADRGRGLVAVRDVAAGELILRDRAVVTLARGVKVEEAGYDITLLQRQVMLS